MKEVELVNEKVLLVSKKVHLNDCRLPDLKGKTVTQKQALFDEWKDRGCEWFYIFKQWDNGDFHYAECEKRLARSGRRVFVSSRWIIKAGVYNGKVYNKGMSVGVTRRLLKELGRECLSELFNCQSLTLTSYMLKGFSRGKFTNERELVSAWLRQSYHIKEPVNLKNLILALKNHRLHVSMADLRDFTTSIDKSVEFFLDDKKIYTTEPYQTYSELHSLFIDLIKDSVFLDTRVNPEWSLKRMREVHQKNIKKILDVQMEVIDNVVYYPSDEGLTIKDDILNVELIPDLKETFRESKEMNHCIYYNYRNSLLNKHYLALRVLSPERCTVGINQNGTIDQVRSYHNHSVSETTFSLIRDFVTNKKQNILRLLKTEPCNGTCVEEDMPF